MKKFIFFILFIFSLLLLIIIINTIRFKSKQDGNIGVRRVFLIDSAAVKHLSSAIRFSSISYDRNNDEITKESKNQLELSANKFIQKTETQFSIFDSLHVFLRNTYPLIFKTLSSKIINNKS